MTTGDKKPYDHDKDPALRKLDGTVVCGRPPVPWTCSREPGHEGPCAASRDENVSLRPTKIDIEEHTDPQPAFYLSKQQRDAASGWVKKHDVERHIRPGKKFRYSGAIGGAYTWRFTATSIGNVTTLECSCGERLDVSDYGSW